MHCILRIEKPLMSVYSNKNRTAHREFRRDQVEFVRLQSLRKMTGKGIWKRGRLALIFNLRVIIVCRRLATTYGKASVKWHFALGLGGKIQSVCYIKLILDFIFGIFAFFSINHHLIDVVGKETLRLRLKPIETNSGCTAVCVMIIYTFEDFLLEKGHRGAPLIFTCN